MKLKPTKGPGISQEFGTALSIFLAALIFFELRLDAVLVLPIIAVVFLVTGLQTAFMRGGLSVSQQGKWKFNLLRNWLFIYASILYGLITLHLVSGDITLLWMTLNESLVFAVAMLFGVTIIRFIAGGDK